jgi:hypothetical protein
MMEREDGLWVDDHIINSNKRASQTTLEISRCMKCTESRQTEAFEGRFARSCRI